MPYKRKNCLAPDIQGHAHNIGQLCMGKETYAVYDAPHDGSCFYYAYSMMVRPHLEDQTPSASALKETLRQFYADNDGDMKKNLERLLQTT